MLLAVPAFGFALTRNEPAEIKLRRSMLPVRRIRAESPKRNESIVYWSRVGEYLPQDGGQQRSARFRTAIQGIIPDGVLCRFSAVSSESQPGWDTIDEFVRHLLVAIPRQHVAVLIGSELARAV